MRSNDLDLTSLVDQQHEIMLEWQEPWPACGPDGEEVDANIALRATVHDCINIKRRYLKQAGNSLYKDDMACLLEFIIVNWAYLV